MAIQPRSSFTYICDDTEIVISARKTVFAGQIRTAAFGTLVSPKEYLKLLRANWTVPNSSEYEFDFRQTRVSNHCVDVVANMTLLATASARQFTDTLRIFWSPEATPFHISFMSPQRTFTTVQVTSLDQTVIALARLVVPRMGVQGRFLVHLGSRRVAPEDTILTMNAYGVGNDTIFTIKIVADTSNGNTGSTGAVPEQPGNSTTGDSKSAAAGTSDQAAAT